MVGSASAVIRKLEFGATLTPAARQAIHLACNRPRVVGARRDVIREGDVPMHLNMFLSGWGCRYKVIADGRRQVVALLLPGDICDHNVFILNEMDHAIATITPMRIAELSYAQVSNLVSTHSAIDQALWHGTLVNAATQREWTFNLGQRTARERLAHLLCEVFVRMDAIGFVVDNGCPFPLTQSDLADATGMSIVHVNRSLQDLRAERLIVLRHRMLIIEDLPRLQRACFFTGTYLHLSRPAVREPLRERQRA